eukprot:CAMPEP_0179491838 /NCGR_PEP_ID=MMETSP0799-20121207/66354_1 /TAXON_ID=46947 /ORGANISM="Geminigera cryophila, Strain CCMP2564" /LENGTH=41 /DNA_ID= /DNA_START= /DNA_END= /DNA_ORIENTATION=
MDGLMRLLGGRLAEEGGVRGDVENVGGHTARDGGGDGGLHS